MAEVAMSSGRKGIAFEWEITENSCHLDNTVFSTGIEGSDIKWEMLLWLVIIGEV
jgi:hypothetical protein